MDNPVHFAEILEAADRLTLEEQETLLDILNRRLVDRRRAELAKDIRQAQKEFDDGGCWPATPDELMREIP